MILQKTAFSSPKAIPILRICEIGIQLEFTRPIPYNFGEVNTFPSIRQNS